MAWTGAAAGASRGRDTRADPRSLGAGTAGYAHHRKITPCHRDLGERDGVTTLSKTGESIFLSWEGDLSRVRGYRSVNQTAAPVGQAGELLAPGDLIRIRESQDGWRLAQVPKLSRLWYHWTRNMVRSARWLAVWASSYPNSIGRLRQSANPARISNRFCMPARYRQASHRLRSSTTHPSCSIIWRQRRSGGLKTTAASSTGQHGCGSLGLLTQSGVDSGIATGRGQGLYSLR